MHRVNDLAVWRQIRATFLGAALLFLINVFFGFDNALTQGVIPRWQVLIHLHAGTLGWITLTLIGVALWLFTGEREVSQTYQQRTGALSWAAILVFAGYIVSFGLAFSQAGAFFVLLPVFGASASLVIWAAAVFALTQLRHQPVVATPHLLIAGGLLVAAVGGTMGFLLGLQNVVGQFLPAPGGDRVGIHAGMMDTYLLLGASAVVEWLIARQPARRWTWPGLVQALAWTVGALLVPLGFLFNLLDALLPLFALLLFVGLGFFLGRTGWRALACNPFGGGVGAWIFFGALWLAVYVAIFIYAAVAIAPDISSAPAWFGAVFAHSAFVGMMTNLLLGVFSARSQAARHILGWGEPVALWLINLGLVTFFGLEILSGTRVGAFVMGAGVLLGVVTMTVRLYASEGAAEAEAVPAA